MPGRGPQLEFRVSTGAKLEQRVVAAIVQFETGDRLRVAAVEPFGKAQDGGQRANRPPSLAFEIAKARLPAPRLHLSMITRDQGDGLDLVRLEPAEVAVPDQVVGMLVMTLVADVDADVMQERGIFEPLTLAIGQTMDPACLVEQADCQARHLLSVLWVVVAPLGELEDTAPADIRIAIGLDDFLAVPGDVVEHQAFAQ
jgi:hypothetical protein